MADPRSENAVPTAFLRASLESSFFLVAAWSDRLRRRTYLAEEGRNFVEAAQRHGGGRGCPYALAMTHSIHLPCDAAMLAGMEDFADANMLAGMERLIAVFRDPRPTSLPCMEVATTETLPRRDAEGDDVLAAAPWRAVELASVDPGTRAGSLARGTVVGRLVILQRLGAGGMGVVHAAYDPELDRKVALKLLLPGAAGDQGRTRLLREAQALAKLSHPNVVAIHDVGTVAVQRQTGAEMIVGVGVGRLDVGLLRPLARPVAHEHIRRTGIGRGVVSLIAIDASRAAGFDTGTVRRLGRGQRGARRATAWRGPPCWSRSTRGSGWDGRVGAPGPARRS